MHCVNVPIMLLWVRPATHDTLGAPSLIRRAVMADGTPAGLAIDMTDYDSHGFKDFAQRGREDHEQAWAVPSDSVISVYYGLALVEPIAATSVDAVVNIFILIP